MIKDKKIILCGQEFSLRADFQALASAEELGRPIFDILVSYSQGQYSLIDTVNIIYCCMKSYYGAPFNYSHPEIGDLVRIEGLGVAGPIAAECVSSLLEGNKEEKKRMVAILKDKPKMSNLEKG